MAFSFQYWEGSTCVQVLLVGENRCVVIQDVVEIEKRIESIE